jgi:hypothetical protein
VVSCFDDTLSDLLSEIAGALFPHFVKINKITSSAVIVLIAFIYLLL